MNRKFILIGLLLGACFAFTVLQAATGEAQQCDPGPACVENCCPAGDPVSGGDVTLDPNIDPQPAPSSSVTLDPNIDPQPYIKPKKQGKVQVQQHEQNQETAGLQGQWISCGANRADPIIIMINFLRILAIAPLIST